MFIIVYCANKRFKISPTIEEAQRILEKLIEDGWGETDELKLYEATEREFVENPLKASVSIK